MANKNIYEVFDEFKAATTKADRIAVLQNNESYALRNVLYGALTGVEFTVKTLPEYKVVEVPPGMSYNNMTQALSQMYLFVVGNNRRPEGLTEDRSNQLLIQLLESLEPREAEVLCNMFMKDLKIPYLTENLVREAFPSLLPPKA